MLKNTKMKIIAKMSLRYVVAIALTVVFPLTVKPANAGAPPIADTPCDSLYYQTLSARAWLEAQREITQNQNLILKPDSVLEYTCFDMFLDELAQHAQNMFSETTAFGNPNPDPSMDNALDDLVGDSLRNFVSANFGYYDMLGGHSAGTGITHIPNTISNGTYTCDMMAQVWTAAKCINFVSDPANDGFYTFVEYRDNIDRRVLPPGSVCTPSPGWAANITTSTITPPWTDDPMQTYLALMDPANCSGSTAIPTGVEVNRPSVAPNTYDEHVCIIPGCRYDPGGGNCVAN